MSRIRKWGAAIGALSLIAAATAAYIYQNGGTPITDDPTASTDQTNTGGSTTTGTGGSGTTTGTPVGSALANSSSDDRRNTYIVVFRDPALASYKGTLPGLPMPEHYRDSDGTLRLDSDGPNSVQYVDYLETRQDNFETQLSTIAGRDVAARLQMQHALNGVILDLSDSELGAVRGMADVKIVEPYREYTLDTDLGPNLIGATPVWNGTNPGAPGPFKGEGVVVGVIDTGINFGSPSFSAVGPVDGYAHTNPLGAGNYLGTCATGGPDAGRCNDKLIGGYDFVCGAPVNACTNASFREEPGFGDTNSHGSHTASTSAGNVRDVVYGGNNLRISGVAPHANIIAYDVCYTIISTGQGSCPSTATVAAVNQAVADGIVDVINYSISGGTDPWSDATSLAFLNAVDSGIFVAASAGNSGPGANTMGHHEPWVSSTAASQTGRNGYSYSMTVTAPAPVPAGLTPVLMLPGSGGVSLTAALPGTTPLRISAGINTTSDGCAAYPANTFAGSIAVIRRGTCSFAIKTNNAAAAGAIAVVIANNQAGTVSPSVPGTTIPVFSVTQADGDALRNFGQANPTTTTAQIPLQQVPLPNTPDALASFSSRGPAGTYNIMKPDVTAPGVQILAAVAGTTLTGAENNIDLMSGTSMASPHQAGSAALVRQARPTWTPPEIKSALALTATQTVYLEDQVTLANPFARGSGRIRVDQAINAGLVMNETTANYTAANPGTGGDPTTLNQPNLYNRSCYPTCTFYRTFRNTKATSSSFLMQLQGVTGSISPMITVPGNGTLTVKYTLYGYSLPTNGNFTFGNVVLTPVSGGPVLRMPVGIAAQPPVATLPNSASLSLATNAVASATYPLSNTGGSNLTYSFVNTGTGSQPIITADNTGVSSGFRNTIYTDPATAGSQAQFSADDFLLTQSTQITSLSVQGFTVSGTALNAGAATNITWSIYPDASGLPAGNPQTNAAAALWTFTATPTATGVTTVGANDIALNLVAAGQNVTLPPGRYWLVVNTRGTFANRYAQYGSNSRSGNANFASITIATNGTGNWAANTSFPGLSMKIVGNVPCGAPWISGTYAASGTLSRGTTVQVMTTVYGTGLAPGSYLGNVCLQSNDPVLPRVAMPLNLTVTP